MLTIAGLFWMISAAAFLEACARAPLVDRVD